MEFILGAITLASSLLSSEQWAEQQFGECDFGDIRRTQRAIRFGASMANNSSGSTPCQTEDWAECKAAYRLIGSEHVTFDAIQQPHRRRTLAQAGGNFLLIGDTTELDFGVHRQTEGLGPTGDGGGRGFFLHSSLMVDADSEAIIGLAGQELFHRVPQKKGESRNDRLLRRRESEVWGRVIDQVGPALDKARFTHVFDRGADNFEVFVHLLLAKTDYVIRAAQLNRNIRDERGARTKLSALLEQTPSAGTYDLAVRASKDHAARTATLEIRWCKLELPVPKHRTPWLREQNVRSVTTTAVEVREVNAPRGVAPLRWVLWTSHDIQTVEGARRVVGYYEKRWLIEEYHKALKTGCRVEQRQYQTSERLETITAFLAIVAVRLLQLKGYARTNPEQPATNVVPKLWVDVVRRLRKQKRPASTVREFFRDLAKLGGFLGRKSDGEPGWQTLWHGFDKLVLAITLLERTATCG